MIRAAMMVAFLWATFSLSALAQDNGISRSLPLPKAKRPSNGMKMVVGTVAEISGSKVVIENDYGARKELKLDAKTRFLLAEKKRVKLTEVKPGVFVKITFRTTDLTATKVQETMKKFQE